jgi:hypothetical protein
MKEERESTLEQVLRSALDSRFPVFPYKKTEPSAADYYSRQLPKSKQLEQQQITGVGHKHCAQSRMHQIRIQRILLPQELGTAETMVAWREARGSGDEKKTWS